MILWLPIYFCDAAHLMRENCLAQGDIQVYSAWFQGEMVWSDSFTSW